MQYKNIHRIEKFKNIQEPRLEKHTFSRTIQDQIKFKNIQEHSRISRTSGHLNNKKTVNKNFFPFTSRTLLYLKTIKQNSGRK